MSVYGCPDTSINNWHYGYINISIMPSIELFEVSIGRIGWDGLKLPLLELYGPYGPHSIQLNFCTKTSNNSKQNNTEWPNGLYSIYGTTDDCPQGELSL